MIRAGQFADALAAARTGAEIAARTSYVHWWESLSGLAAIRAGMYDVAIAHCEAAHYRSPTFRGAMRPLLFLYLAAGAREKAARVLRNLQRVEPDFSLALIRDDPEYPAVTLRRAGLIAALWRRSGAVDEGAGFITSPPGDFTSPRPATGIFQRTRGTSRPPRQIGGRQSVSPCGIFRQRGCKF